MKLKKLAKVMGYCIQNPRESYHLVARSPRLDLAEEFAGHVKPPEDGPPPAANTDPRYRAGENPLWDYFQAHHEGPGIYKWTHYFEIYQRHFAKFVGRKPHVVEVGIYSGGSLGMWRNYFGEGCHVSGIDIEAACRVYENDHTTIYIGDQADPKFWRKFREQAPPVDILIDDGGHSPEQQRVTLEEMLPHLNPGGVFLCEDVHGVDNPFATYANHLTNRLHFPDLTQLRQHDGGLAAESVPFQQVVHSAHVYPFAIVFERTESSFDGFRCPRHGTEWQPFLQ